MPSRLTWDTEDVERKTKHRVARGLGKISRAVQRVAQRSISRKFPPASKAGQPPHMRSGTLQEGIVVESHDEGLTQEIGLTAKAWYGLLLERGTSRIKRRPFLLPALREATATAKNRQIFTDGD